MIAEGLQDLVNKKGIQEFIRQEVERQTRGILKKNFSANEGPGDFELLPAIRDEARHFGDADMNSIVSPHAQETTLLLNNCENWNRRQPAENATNRLENTADSLLDVRLEHLKMDPERAETRRFPDYDNRMDAVGDRSNKWELYFYHTIYVLTVFWAFFFAIIYVWWPIIKDIMYGKPTNNATHFANQNHNNF